MGKYVHPKSSLLWDRWKALKELYHCMQLYKYTVRLLERIRYANSQYYSAQTSALGNKECGAGRPVRPKNNVGFQFQQIIFEHTLPMHVGLITFTVSGPFPQINENSPPTLGPKPALNPMVRTKI